MRIVLAFLVGHLTGYLVCLANEWGGLRLMRMLADSYKSTAETNGQVADSYAAMLASCQDQRDAAVKALEDLQSHLEDEGYRRMEQD